MTFAVSVSAQAQKDAEHLDEWLSARDARAAERLGTALEAAFDSLAETPLRGRMAGPTTREINVPFGRDAYIIRYRISARQVIVTRIWHSLERR